MKHLLLLLVILAAAPLSSAQSVERFVKSQMATYPKSRLLDIYKSCFQDYMGAEHLVSDRERVKAYLDEELATTSLDDLLPWYYEPCGMQGRYVRVSLRAVKEGLINAEQLLDVFIRSANESDRHNVDHWRKQWERIVKKIDKIGLQLPEYEADRQWLDNILKEGKYAISHSPEYREAYNPHYRIVKREIFENELKPIIDQHIEKQ